jgi:hypothetical protein
MCEDKIEVAIAVNIADSAALGVVAVGDEVLLPESTRWRRSSGILVPPDAVGNPTGSNEVGEAVVVNVDGPLAAVGDELAVDADGAELVPLPLAALGTGVLIPVSSAQDIEEAVAVHI